MVKFGDEKQFLVSTPLDEVVKGYPEAELKWMFGEKEVIVPKAIQYHLFRGWKKWREEAKADLKRDLLEDTYFGKQCVAQRQEPSFWKEIEWWRRHGIMMKRKGGKWTQLLFLMLFPRSL